MSLQVSSAKLTIFDQLLSIILNEAEFLYSQKIKNEGKEQNEWGKKNKHKLEKYRT